MELGLSLGAATDVDEAGKLSMDGEWREEVMELCLEGGEGTDLILKKELCGEGGEPRNLDFPTTHELLGGAAAAIKVASFGCDQNQTWDVNGFGGVG